MDKVVSLNFKGINLEVEGFYSEGEDCIMYDSNMSGYPGSSPEFEISKVSVWDSDEDIFLLVEEYEDILVEECLEKIEG